MKETQGLAFQRKTDFKLHRGMKARKYSKSKSTCFLDLIWGFSPWGDDVGIPHIRKLMS